jgi:hypothetical protein
MNEIFSGARVPGNLVGRKAEIQRIHDEIYRPGKELRIVCLLGPGGYGKTRILREAMRRAGHAGERQAQDDPAPADDWAKLEQTPVHIADLIDLTSVRLATAIHFQHQLQLALDTEGRDFSAFKRLFLRYRDQLTYQSSFIQMKEALDKAQQAFQEDYEKLSARQRVVWVLDTAEKFPMPVTNWVEDLLPESTRPEGHTTRTQDWLRFMITSGQLSNTTILVAGRAELEWDRLFQQPGAEPVILELPPFDAEATRDYFDALTHEWKEREPASPFLDYFEEFATPERAEVLHLYTGGQPVRLALFTDVMMEGQEEPVELNESLAEARARLGWQDGKATPERLQAAQQRLDGEFIDILFSKAAEIRSQILSILVRTQRPMNARTLAFVMHSKSELRGVAWGEDPEIVRRIEDTLRSMRPLSFIKYSPTGEYWLQDEIYSLFDRRPLSATGRDGEIRERKRLFDRVTEFLNGERTRCERTLREFWHQDLRKLLMEAGHETARQGDLSPLQIEMISFSRVDELDPEENEERASTRDELEALLLDLFYYRLRLDPASTFNNDYYELADNAWWEFDEDFMTQVQVQLWRFLRSDLAWEFAVVEQTYRAGNRVERLRDLLLRLAEQDSAIRWLKRLQMRGQYEDVKQLADRIRQRIDDLDHDRHEYHSWNHTVTQNEIRIYEEYAQTFLGGQQALEAESKLQNATAALERAFVEGTRERAEDPFREDHPAHVRIERLLGTAWFCLGYAYASGGRFGKALDAYKEGLPYLRTARFEPLQVQCMFHLGRVLAERGHTKRAARICNDAIELLDNRGRGGTKPYALAENTLALVYNRGHQSGNAWRQTAIAHACFERVGDLRGQGLAKLQIGEALRRLGDAYEDAPHSRSYETVTALFRLSERYLREALRIFEEEPTLNVEVLRQIEAHNELGSSLREQAHYLVKQANLLSPTANAQQYRKLERKSERLLKEADEHFQRAATLAQENEHAILVLDAQWGIAKVAYSTFCLQPSAENAGTAQQAGNRVIAAAVKLKLLPVQSKLDTENSQPDFSTVEPTVLRLVSHAYTMLAQTSFACFEDRAEQIRSRWYTQYSPLERATEKSRRSLQEMIRDDPDAEAHLRAAIERYAVALAYAYVYSPHSNIVSDIYDDLYGRIKRLSDILMKKLVEELNAARKRYHLDQIKTESMEDAIKWLDLSFGYRVEAELGQD